MRRTVWMAWTLSLPLAAGCGSEHSLLAAGEEGPPAVQRSQKPDSDSGTPPVQKTTFETSTEPFPGLPGGKVSVKIMAEVNCVPILEEEVVESCKPLLERAPTLKDKAEVLNKQLQAIIDREVILQDLYSRVKAIRPQYMEKLEEAAHKEYKKQVRAMEANARKAGLNIEDEEALRKILAQQGMSLDNFKRQTERQFMAMEYMRSRIFPKIEMIGHEEIVEYYKEHASEFQIQDTVTWQDIFIDVVKFRSRLEAKTFADQLVARARAGEDFGKLLQYDNGDSTYRNGLGLGNHHGEIKPPEVEPVLFQLHDGEVGPVVEVVNGFHIVRLVKRDYAGLKPLDDKVQGDIRKKLQNEAADREYKRLLAELKARATIEVARQ